MTPEEIINAYTVPLYELWTNNLVTPREVYNIPRDVMCTIFATKYTAGDQPADGEMPLADCLQEQWPCDLHFVQYTSKPSVRCLKAETEWYKLSFRFVAVDLDHDRHGRQPTRQDFADLCRTCYVIGVEDHLTPSILYETRGGARAIWLIEELTNAEEFESHYGALLTKLDAIFCNCTHDYRVDTAVRDWTRLYRSALVTRDDVPEYGRMVRVFHADPLDLKTFRPKPKPVRKPAHPNGRYDGTDLRLLKLLRVEMCNGRNVAGFSAACHCFRNYKGEHLENAINAVRDSLANAGIDEREIEQIINSASKQEIKN